MITKQTISKEWLYEQYITLNKNRYCIAETAGVTPEKIGALLQKYGIKRYSLVRHGKASHPLNTIWCGMKERCGNPNAHNYKWYGGRGIKVCDEWMQFLPFYNWAIEQNWEPGLTIDRICGDGDYSPENCRLITLKEQCRNRRSNVSIEVNGEIHLQCEWEELLGLPKKTISKWKRRHDLEYVVNRIKEIRRNSQEVV